MRRWLPAVTLAASLLGGAASGLSAQVGEPIDRIVAVVGTTPILFSMVEERFYQNQANPAARIPKDSVGVASYKRLLVDTLINEELLYQEAIKDTTIQVTDQEVAEAVVGQRLRHGAVAERADQHEEREEDDLVDADPDRAEEPPDAVDHPLEPALLAGDRRGAGGGLDVSDHRRGSHGVHGERATMRANTCW